MIKDYDLSYEVHSYHVGVADIGITCYTLCVCMCLNQTRVILIRRQAHGGI